MIRIRIACGFLAGGMVAAATACAPAVERATGALPVAATVSQPPSSQPPSDKLSPLLEQALPNVKGKTFTSAIVDFPPTARAAPHRHGNAFVYAYVLEGTVRSQLGGEAARTYRQGEDWVEPPGAHHVLAENTSRTQPAKLLVIFISDTGDKIKVDDRPR
ncbi:cupin domain-containing protein [Streptosporangium lutulentum]|uniref:Quercetin dioxygenase-like cupin family protein n=1 Tax=Streptosporangium lutulentum TaxID=1461250 RepID=A0ABT9Q7G2_9ACTN|nr:cupin domain-containing protein [Streptosporangium lutulentum]MDP9842695.1 quercetin dioxygenase-like cupin family protein [Streptosporangium lutulentum]